MNNTGRKSVKGESTSAPKLVKATGSKPNNAGVRQPPTREEIARRSYEIFLECGCQEGHDLEHWVQAERELGAQRSDQSN